MANADVPFGFKPVANLDSSPWSGGTLECAILAADGTATFIGDAVKLSGTADADGVPSVVQCAAGDEIFGVVVSFDADRDDLSKQYREASTLRKCRVVPALDALFEIQEDSDGGALAITDVGNTFGIIVGSGDTINGTSAMELDSSDVAGSEVQILGLARRPDNEVGNQAVWVVRINTSSLRGDGTGV